MTYSMDDYLQQQKDIDARATLLALKLELATRETNEHVGSGLGGNPTDFWWMLNHTIKAVGIDPGAMPSFSRVGSQEIVFYAPKKPSMKHVRQALTKFLDENYPTRQVVTQEQLANPSFVKDWAHDKLEVKLFIQCLELTQELVGWIDLKIQMQRSLHALQDKEEKDIAKRFLRERGLPETYFETLPKETKGDPITRMLRRHPVWAPKQKAIASRYSKMTSGLISPEDAEKLEMVGAYPQYMALFAFRSLVQIERIVELNLDEHPACKFLSEINKDMNDQSDDDNGVDRDDE